MSQKKKINKKYPPSFSKYPIPHHQKNKFLGKLKSPTFLPWKTTKLLPPMPPNKQTFGLVPIPLKNHLSQSLKKTSFGKGWNYPIFSSSPKNNIFGN
jgi:hypothetical protein